MRERRYDLTVHALEELAEDGLDVAALEVSVAGGRLVETDKADPRGTRYTVEGPGTDGSPVASVGRFSRPGCYLIITVYRVPETES